MLVTTALVLGGRRVIPTDGVSHDFICYWSTGKILVSLGSPYDPQLQTRIQTQYGWDKETRGHGIWDYVPFYYPPSLLAPFCVVFLPFGYPTAKIVWLVVNVELLFLSGYLLHKAVPDAPPAVPLSIVPLFAFSGISALIGQLGPLILFLFLVTLRLLQLRWDRAAGWLLAWIMIKPQLSVLLTPALLLWAAREGRWNVVSGFAISLTALLAVATLLTPNWPVELIKLHLTTPIPTAERPWRGATWPLLLRTLGLTGPLFWTGCVTVAVPLVVYWARTVLRRTRGLEDLFGLSIMVPFFFAPYGRTYDFPVLLIPLVILLARGRKSLWSAALLVVVLVVPLFHWWLLGNPHHASFFWIPLLLTGAWLATDYCVTEPTA